MVEEGFITLNAEVMQLCRPKQTAGTHIPRFTFAHSRGTGDFLFFADYLFKEKNTFY